MVIICEYVAVTVFVPFIVKDILGLLLVTSPVHPLNDFPPEVEGAVRDTPVPFATDFV